jgi:hypothetical protein
MRLLGAFCSRVSVRRVGPPLQTREGCASHSEAATGTIVSHSHGPVGCFARASLLLVRPAAGQWRQRKKRAR